jgi:hypothetical protein
MCTPVSASSKVVQLIEILRTKNAESISILTWFLSAFTNFSKYKDNTTCGQRIRYERFPYHEQDKLTSYSVTIQVVGQRWSPQLKDRGCDTVLPGQGCHTSQRAVIDEYGAMIEWWLARESWINPEMNLLQCHAIHHEPYMKSPVIDPEAPWWEASAQLPEL